MPPLRWVIVSCILLQLAIADSGGSAEENDEAFTTWSDDPKSDAETIEQEGVEPLEEAEETNEVPEERELSQRERILLEQELHWQATVEEVERREREAALQNPDSHDLEADEEGQAEYSEEQQFEQEEPQSYDPYDEDIAYNDYLERMRRLDEQSGDNSVADEEEEEALPLIPGLTDIELVAFNAEYANEEVLDKIIDWSYDQAAGLSKYRDNYVHTEDLYLFLLKTLNPLDEEIDAEDEEILQDAVARLRKEQGLVDDEQVLYRGFIARGMPLRFLQGLAHDMHQTVQTRRLQASGGHGEL